MSVTLEQPHRSNRILVEIQHPAHVHNFKYLIQELEKHGHSIKIATADKDVAIDLLKAYGFDYDVIYTNKKGGFFNKVVMFLVGSYGLYGVSKKFKPDIYVSRVSPISAVVSRLFGKKHVAFDDTEHMYTVHTISVPLSDVIVTPDCYRKDLGRHQLRVNSYKELAYLHPHYFTPDPSVLGALGLSEGETFTVMRFVSWDASHDAGEKGLSMETKRHAIHEFLKFGRVFITSEKPLPEEFEQYRLALAPEKIHDLLYYASLLYGESGTMAAESAVLGTHAIFCDFEGRGYTDDLEKHGLVYNYKLDGTSQQRSIEKGMEILGDPDCRAAGKMKMGRLLKEKVDLTAFLYDVVLRYISE